jgi:hypothetical protein
MNPPAPTHRGNGFTATLAQKTSAYGVLGEGGGKAADQLCNNCTALPQLDQGKGRW